MPDEDALNDSHASESTAIAEVIATEDVVSPTWGGDVNFNDQNRVDSFSETELQFYSTDQKGTVMETKIAINDPVPVTGLLRQLNILVSWPEKLIDQYDTCMLDSLPEIFKSGSFSKRPQESVSLYNCLEAFLKEEPLGPEDMWLVFTLNHFSFGDI